MQRRCFLRSYAFAVYDNADACKAARLAANGAKLPGGGNLSAVPARRTTKAVVAPVPDQLKSKAKPAAAASAADNKTGMLQPSWCN